MCGIAAICADPSSVDTQYAVRAMLGETTHRGTDDQSVDSYADRSVSLGINRLAIVDVDGGNQPLHGAGGLVHVVGNGFLYNYESINMDMEDCGRVPPTGNDFQVVPYLYETVGRGFVEQLDGMFAVCLFDERTGILVFARDHIGKKPLYYVATKTSCFVCSECKGLAAALTSSMISGICELPPGHVATFDTHTCRLSVDRYYHIPRRPQIPCPRMVRALLTHAVQKRMRADVGVGTFLSGGVDSSIITAVASTFCPTLKAITVGVEGSPDLTNARRVATHLGIEHIVCTFTEDELMALIPHMVWHLESYNPSAINCAVVNYLAAQKAREMGLSVILCGEGADELFGGYLVLRDMGCEEFVKSSWQMIENIHMTECKRLDRSTMAATIEARCPFLDRGLVEYAMNLPYRCKLRRGDDGRVVEKHILREAFADVLPAEVVWREKEPFDQGSGGRCIISRIQGMVSDEELVRLQCAYPDAKIESKEMAYLYTVFRARFGDMGGSRQFAMFGNYPIMQANITKRTATSGS